MTATTGPATTGPATTGPATTAPATTAPATTLSAPHRVGVLPGDPPILTAVTASDPLPMVATPTGVFAGRPDGTWAHLGAGLPAAAVLHPGRPDLGGPWAGSGRGLHRWNPERSDWRIALEAPAVTSIAMDGGTVIAGTADDGIFRSTDGGETWRSASSGLLDFQVAALAEAGGRFFAGTPTGVHRSGNQGRSWRAVDPATPAVRALVTAGAGLIAATADGLWSADADGRRWQPIGATVGMDATTACGLADGRVAFLTNGEVWHADADTAPHRLPPLPSHCLALATDPDRRTLFAGTRSHGLLRLAASGTWVVAATPLPPSAVGQVELTGDGTILWASADRGLLRWVPGADEWRAVGPPNLCVHRLLPATADQPMVAATDGGLFAVEPDGWRSLRDGPVSAVARTGRGLVCASPGSGTVFLSTGAGSQWPAVSELPAPVVALHDWVGDLVAVTATAQGVGFRRSLWRAPGPHGPWRQLLSTVNIAPLVVDLRGDHGFAAVGATLMRLDRGGAGRPTAAGRVGVDGIAAVVVDLTTGPDGALVAATSLGPLTSVDGGRSWTPLAPELDRPCVSVTATVDTVLLVDRDACVWRLDGERRAQPQPRSFR